MLIESAPIGRPRVRPELETTRVTDAEFRLHVRETAAHRAGPSAMRALLRGLARVAWNLLGAGLVVGGIALAIALVFPNALFLVDLGSEPAPWALPSPVAGVAARKVGSSFGAPRGLGRRHEGVDILATRGTPVVATTRGLVWRVGEDTLGGHVVFVLGPGRQLHYYAHLDRFAAIHPGERVAAGDVLGYVGTTGNARGGPPHLHYGIYPVGGPAIDPSPLLRAGASQAGTGTGAAL